MAKAHTAMKSIRIPFLRMRMKKNHCAKPNKDDPCITDEIVANEHPCK